MTYCIGINVNEGMVFASDSRTNAGLDDINTYTKMFNYAVGDRNLVIVTSGNLATSQAVFSSIKKDNFYPVTSNEMTRFSLSLNRSIELVYWTLKNSIGAEIVVPKIPSYKIIDLVKSFNSKAKIKLIGLRPGEKLHEEMISVHDSLNTIEANDKYLILPSSLSTKQKKKYLKKFSAKPVQKNFKYSSNTNKFFLSINELKKIIRLHRF